MEFQDVRVPVHPQIIAPAAPVRQVARTPSWLIPTLATLLITIIAAVSISDYILGSRLVAVEKSAAGNSIKDVELSKQLSEADALFTKQLAKVKCTLIRHLQAQGQEVSGLEGCCPVNWEALNNSCYYASDVTLTWRESRDWCQKEGAQLLILSSDQDWEYVQKLVPFHWVGLSDVTGKWQWVDGSPYVLNPSHWLPGQPDNWYGSEDCTHVQNGRFNDLLCGRELRFICKI